MSITPMIEASMEHWLVFRTPLLLELESTRFRASLVKSGRNYNNSEITFGVWTLYISSFQTSVKRKWFNWSRWSALILIINVFLNHILDENWGSWDPFLSGAELLYENIPWRISNIFCYHLAHPAKHYMAKW